MLALSRLPLVPVTLAILIVFSLVVIFETPARFKNSIAYRGWTPGLLKNLGSEPAPHSNSQKPNLIVSAIDGAGMLENIFKFMGSLEVSLGQEMLAARRENRPWPAEVEVKIITPPEFARDLPAGFNAILRRHKNLEFLGVLPMDLTDQIVFSRFAGWARLLPKLESSYDRVLVCDLDIVFQRNPFSMTMDGDVQLLLFGEWHGFKIGQCFVHANWFNGCINTSHGPFITREDYESMLSFDRICAGTTYGTAQAISVYVNLMASELARSYYECNDQALHIQLYYSGKLQEALTAESAGKVKVQLDEDTLLGTVGTTPFIRYNEWGEMINDVGEVQVAVHQFKYHPRLQEMVNNKYGWQAQLATSFPPMPVMHPDTAFSMAEPNAMPRYLMLDVDGQTCKDNSLCACKWDDCQFHQY